MKQLVLVFIGGGLGSSLRYLFSKYLNSDLTGLPYATFAVNSIGSLLIGIIFGFVLKNDSLTPNTVLFLATGFCGGFTTFSTFSYENYVFLKAGDFISFALYTIASFGVGIAMVFLGIWLVKII